MFDFPRRTRALHRLRGLAASALGLAACLALAMGFAPAALAELAPYVTLTTISDGNPATNELGFAGVEINATAFKNQSLVTVGDYQFTSFYTGSSSANDELVIGRRNLVASPNVWSLVHTGFQSFNINDSHNVSSIGVDGDGFLHVSWGMHNHPMQYARSTTTVVNDDPIAMTGVLANQFPLQSGGDFTYPEFYNIPDSGDLLFAYRTGVSGNGEYQLARWDDATNVWNAVHAARNSTDASAVQPWMDNDFGGDSNVDANAYFNGLQYDSTGRLHVTWTWRAGTNLTGFNDYQSNHNIMYAYSDNDGVDWRLQNGTLLQRDPTGAPPITHDIDEANAMPVINLPHGSSLINQASSAIGPDDHLYTATWYAPNAAGGNHTRQYMLLEFDGTTWEQHQVGARATENSNSRVPESSLATFRMSRPIVLTDSENRVFVVYSDYQRDPAAVSLSQKKNFVTIAYSESAERDDWQVIDLATEEDVGLWEPKYDLTRWERDGILSMLYQPAGNNITPAPTQTPVSILEWNARSFFRGGLVLNVDRATGAVSLANSSKHAIALEGYSIASASGQLAPVLWRSLADQGLAGWIESPPNDMTLAEASETPLDLATTAARSLGRPYAGSATAFGVDAPADLVFRYTVDGEEVVGTVNYAGPSLNTLTLLVDPETGEARLKNTSPFSVAIDGYTIQSGSGSLLPATWTSLDDQDAAGGDWAESNVGATALSELKPTASTLLAGGDAYALGTLFAGDAGTQDLTLGFLIAGQSVATPGVVLYTPVTPSADFDGDSDVDGADFLIWQRGLGGTIDAAHGEGDADHDGDVDSADLTVWRSAFGGGAVANAAVVPEPSAFILAAAGVVFTLRVRKSSRAA
jgi:hypothetical protein